MGSHRRTLAAVGATLLASFSLYPIFIGMAWFWAGVGSTLMVALVGTLTRLRRLPVAVCLLGGLAGLLLYLNDAFESARSWAHLVPTATSVRLLWDLARTGFRESAKYAPPVPELPGMLMLAAAGIGLTALLTDLIAVRLESAALAGLPLLLLYTEPFTLSVARSGLGTTIVFCLGTAGYLALLSSEGKDRIKEWERPNPRPDEIPDTHALATTGRRVGLASVVFALCVPLFIPGLHATRLFGGQPGIGGIPTAGGVGFPDPNVQLSNQLHESQPAVILTYTSTDLTPAYLQIYVLDNLTDSGWQMFSQPKSLVSVSPQVPIPSGMTNRTYDSTEQTTISIGSDVGQDELGALPVPYPATAIRTQASGTLQEDQNSGMVFDDGATLAELQYKVTSLNIDQAPQQKVLDAVPPPPGSIANNYMEVPSSYDQLVKFLPASVKDAKTSFEKALALQDWLSQDGGFKYTLNAPSILNEQGLAKFLTTKKGYCQQFSFAMAVFARLLGIPSRIAYGYTPGTLIDSTWVVTTHDAHSWPQLYLQGFGWLRFEPTPTGTGGQGTATSPSYTQHLVNPLTPTAPTATTPDTGSSSTAGPNPGFNFHALPGRGGFPPQSGANGHGGASGSGRLSAWDIFLLVLLGLLGLLVIASAAPSCARVVIRRRRWRSGQRQGDAGLANAAWRELRDDLVDYRAGYLPSESPRALEARVGGALELTEPAKAALHRIAMAEERARYSARPNLGAGLREDSAVVRRAIAATATRRTRWVARLVPSSVLTPVMFRLALATDFSGRDLLGRSRFDGVRLSRTRFGRGRGAGAPADGQSAARTEPPVGAGARRD